MSDNEAMYHAVAPTGSAEARDRFAGQLGREDRLWPLEDGAWEIRDDRRAAARFDEGELRMSLLWKARVFRDEAHRASFDDDRFDLTPERIAEVFLADLAARGLAVKEPSDPHDPAWQDMLVEMYPQTFTARTVDCLDRP
jgi:hypothetical protein